MWKEAALITVSCVLFISMGLEDAIENTLHCKFKIISCPKCCTFWSVLTYSLLQGGSVVQTVAVSFLCSYTALWLTLIIDGLTAIYNKAYEYIIKNTGTSEDSTAAADKAGAGAESETEVP